MRNIATAQAQPTQDAMLWIWGWLQVHRRIRMALIISAICTLCWFVNVSAAHAVDGTAMAQVLAPPLANVTDSEGVPMVNYIDLPLDYGRLTYPGRLVRGFGMRILWALYIWVVLILLAFVDFVISMAWVEWIASPIVLLANSIDGILQQTGILGLGIAVAALFVGFLVLRGDYSTAIIEFAAVCLVVGLVGTAVGNPAQYLEGEDGWLATAAEYGSDLGRATIAEGGQGEPAETSNPVSSGIVDLTVRQPAQLLAFGRILDGECNTTFTDKAKTDDAEGVRKAVNGCDEYVKSMNETDSGTIFGMFFMVAIGSFGILFVIGVLVFFLIKEAVFALMGAVNTVIRAHLVAFPMARYAFFNALLQMLVCVFFVGVYIWATATYMWVIAMIAAAMDQSSVIVAKTLYGVVVFIMAVSFFMAKRRGKSAAQALARALGRMGVSTAPKVKGPSKFSQYAGPAAKTAAKLWKMRRLAALSGVGAAAFIGTDAVKRMRKPQAPQFAPELGPARTRAAAELGPARTRQGPGTPALPVSRPRPAPVAPGNGGATAQVEETSARPALSAPIPAGIHAGHYGEGVRSNGSGLPPQQTAVPAGPQVAPTPSAAPTKTTGPQKPSTPAHPLPAPGRTPENAQPAPARQTPATPSPKRPSGHRRFNNVRVSTNGSVREVLVGQIHEGPLPQNLKYLDSLSDAQAAKQVPNRMRSGQSGQPRRMPPNVREES